MALDLLPHALALLAAFLDAFVFMTCPCCRRETAPRFREMMDADDLGFVRELLRNSVYRFWDTSSIDEPVRAITTPPPCPGAGSGRGAEG